MRARFVVRISPEDVGSRVSVRRRIPAEPGMPGHSDVIGELVAWADGIVSILRRDGSTVRIPEADLVAGRRVPPPPVR